MVFRWKGTLDESGGRSAAVPETHNALISQGVEGNQGQLERRGRDSLTAVQMPNPVCSNSLKSYSDDHWHQEE